MNQKKIKEQRILIHNIIYAKHMFTFSIVRLIDFGHKGVFYKLMFQMVKE